MAPAYCELFTYDALILVNLLTVAPNHFVGHAKGLDVPPIAMSISSFCFYLFANLSSETDIFVIASVIGTYDAKLTVQF